MIDRLQLFLLVLILILSVADVVRLRQQESRKVGPGEWIRRLASHKRLVIAALAITAFLGCIAVAMVLYEPVPRVQDEFSYLLMGDTFAHGRAANPTPALPEFFETFEVLLHPSYASKYYPAQGLFLALGQALTNHPAVGLWLSSAAACAALCWMLQAWAGPVWGLVGGLLVVLQWGIFSYWSQTYWGGMTAALGGALCFGALRRLWERLSWSNGLWFGLGAVILANSRPVEGFCAVAVACAVLLVRIGRTRQWMTPAFWQTLLPFALVLLLGAAATGAYNRAVTGSAFHPPYFEHERQYQQTPAFVFQSMRPHIAYANDKLATFYGKIETGRFRYRRVFWPCSVAMTLRDFRSFYFGFLFCIPLALPGLLRRGWIRYAQFGTLAALFTLAAFYESQAMGVSEAIDLLAIVEIVLLWLIFDGFWQRLSIGVTVLLLVVGCISKWFFPHYLAPAACLIWFLQVDGLSRIWHWQPRTKPETKRRPARERKQAGNNQPGVWSRERLRLSLRNLVFLFPVLCALSLTGRVVMRYFGTPTEDLSVDWQTLVKDRGDWALQRASIQRWLQERAGSQLVFVHYTPGVGLSWEEWVFNAADIPHAKVVWARDLGEEHNRLLLRQMPARTPWMLNADEANPRLLPYRERGQAR